MVTKSDMNVLQNATIAIGCGAVSLIFKLFSSGYITGRELLFPIILIISGLFFITDTLISIRIRYKSLAKQAGKFATEMVERICGECEFKESCKEKGHCEKPPEDRFKKMQDKK